MRRLLVLLLVLAGCSAPPAPSPDDRWQQVFRDDFDSLANWRYDLGHCYPGCPAPNWGTGEIARMGKANVSVDNGHLAITPVLRDGQWTSGRIETVRSDFAFPPGGTLRVEGSMRLPDVSIADGAGYWPAFWMMGAPIRENGYTGWPTWGELDIMEQVNGAAEVYSAMHLGSLPTPTDHASAPRPCTGCASGFHLYAVELSTEEARFYVDGELHYRIPGNGSLDWKNATEHGFFLILNVAMGGFWPGPPTASTVDGKPLLVDYVAVYTRNGT